MKVGSGATGWPLGWTERVTVGKPSAGSRCPPTPHCPAPPAQKAESEELETQKPQVKLRRTVSEVVRPASTPPIIASAIKDDDDEDRIIAELEVSAGGAAGCPSLPAPQAMPTLPCPLTRGCSRHLRGTPRDQVPGTASQASARQRASPSSPARRQKHGAAGMGGTERLHPAGPLAGSGCCVPGSPSLFSTSTPSWALSQTHLVFNAARLQLEVCRDLCRGHPAESPPEMLSRGSETPPSWLYPMSSPVCCGQGAPVGCG